MYCAYDLEHRHMDVFCVCNNHLSSNAGLFAQVHWRVVVFCIRTQIFLIMILIVQRYVICAYEQVPHRDMDVLSNAGLFEHMTKYLIDTWMYSAY